MSMSRNWLIALACSACFAAPAAQAQSSGLSVAPQQRAQPPVHRTMSPIGKAMAALLRQADVAPANATTTTRVASQQLATDDAANVSVAPAVSAATIASRPAAEIAVEPSP